MIWLEELQTRKKISRIFSQYEKTFPEEERRSKEQFIELIENPDAYIFMAKNEDENIGYVVFWKLSDFCFLEHFEVFEEFRNQNFGQQILNILSEKFHKIVLESEPENLSEIAHRRISFYKRNGYRIIEKNYVQPSYGEGKKSVNLWLLGTWKPKDLDLIIITLYKKVYT